MSKIYQPIVLEHANELVESLLDSGFFGDYEITDTTFAKEYFCDKLTEKFIVNGLDLEIGLFTDEEFLTMLKEIAAGSELKKLKDYGYITSYEDENTEEVFYLTEEGKKYLKDKMNDDEI
jgi:hypothetical protein